MHRKHSRPFQHETFDLRIQPTSPREYNALADPHANYYFVSTAAKQRLKDLKRELRKEKHGKSNDQKQLLKLIREKIRFKFPKIHLPLVNQKELNAIISSSRQHSEQGLPKTSLGKPVPASRQEYAVEFVHQEERERLQTDTKKSFSCNKPEKLRKSINHSDFVQFLVARKSQLLDSTQPDYS